MNKVIEVLEYEEEYESPYCEICGHCGEIGCCGIRNFIDKHIEGKTNCKNEGFIINDLINLCDYKDEVFEENKRLNNIINELKEDIVFCINGMKNEYACTDGRTNRELHTMVKILEESLDKIKELKESDK